MAKLSDSIQGIQGAHTTMIGIDIAKATLDVAVVLESGKHRTRSKIANTPKGHQDVLAWLHEYAPDAAVGMEATGSYHEALADYLVAQGVTVYVFNPAQVAAYAKSELSRTKTDRCDAKLIARFGLAMRAANATLHPYIPLPPAQRVLKALVMRLDDLNGMRQMEANRRDVAHATVLASLDRVIAALDQQIAATAQAIKQHINDDPDLRGRRDLLNTIPGIADTTSAWLMALLGDTRQFADVRKMVAFVGLDPRIRESGLWKGRTRISKTGNSLLRAKLFMPAVTARTHNPIVRAFCDRLAQHGKPKMVVAVAAMRKLLHIVWGVLRNQQSFNPVAR